MGRGGGGGGEEVDKCFGGRNTLGSGVEAGVCGILKIRPRNYVQGRQRNGLISPLEDQAWKMR